MARYDYVNEPGARELVGELAKINDETTGINLLRGTRDFTAGTESAGVYETSLKKDGWVGISGGSTVYSQYIDDEGYGVLAIDSTASAHVYTASFIPPETIAGKTVTVSFEVMFEEHPSANDNLFQILPHSQSSSDAGTSTYIKLSSNVNGYTFSNIPLNEWIKVVAQVSVPYLEDYYYRIGLYNTGNQTPRKYRKVKVEVGAINNPIWSPSPFDIMEKQDVLSLPLEKLGDLGDKWRILAESDLNDYTEPGMYYFTSTSAKTILNLPDGFDIAAKLKVENSTGDAAYTMRRQTLVGYSESAKEYIRHFSSSGWTDWRQTYANTTVRPIEGGGTGASDSKGAQYNLLKDMTLADSNIYDTNNFVMAYDSPSSTNGAILKKPMTTLWTWIKSKIQADKELIPDISVATVEETISYLQS